MELWPPCPAPFNLARHVLEASAARLPDKSALQILRPTGAERWSYARLEAAVAEDEALRRQRAQKAAAREAGQGVDHDDEEPALPPVRLAQRAAPMQQMLRRCISEEADLVWGV